MARWNVIIAIARRSTAGLPSLASIFPAATVRSLIGTSISSAVTSPFARTARIS